MATYTIERLDQIDDFVAEKFQESQLAEANHILTLLVEAKYSLTFNLKHPELKQLVEEYIDKWLRKNP